MNLFHRTNWKFIVIVVISAVLVGGGVLYYARLSSLPETPLVIQPHRPLQQNQSQIDTSNWQTYRNEEFGFELRYPHSRYQECTPTTFSSPFREEGTKTLFFVGMSLNLVDAKGLELNEFVTQYRNKLISKLVPMEGAPGSYWGTNPRLPAKTSLGGREALEVVSDFIGAYPDTIYDIFAKQNEKIFIFSFSTKLISKSRCVTEPTDEYKPETLEALARQILATFRFVEAK